LVAIGQNQSSSIAKVISSDQVGNELLATLRESFNLPMDLGLDLALQDPIIVQHIYTGLDNINFGGVFLSLPISEVRGALIRGHTPCTGLHDEILEVDKETSPKVEKELFIATLETF